MWILIKQRNYEVCALSIGVLITKKITVILIFHQHHINSIIPSVHVASSLSTRYLSYLCASMCFCLFDSSVMFSFCHHHYPSIRNLMITPNRHRHNKCRIIDAKHKTESYCRWVQDWGIYKNDNRLVTQEMPVLISHLWYFALFNYQINNQKKIQVLT